MPQKLVIDPDMPLRARDVVSLGLDGHRLGFAFPSRQRRELVEAALSDVGAAGYADARVGELSGGEQQRVLIAHALISRPKLLLLDEPLANLDLRSEQEIVAVLGKLAREQEIAVLLSAHDMNPLLGVMDRIVYVAERPGRHRRRPTRWSPPRASPGSTATRWTWSGCTAGSSWWRASRACTTSSSQGCSSSGPVRTALLVGAVVADHLGRHRRVHRAARPVLRRALAGRRRHHRRVRRVPGRPQPVLGLPRRRDRRRRADGGHRRAAPPGPGRRHRRGARRGARRAPRSSSTWARCRRRRPGASFTVLFGSIFVISPDTVPALIASGVIALVVVAVLARVLLLTSRLARPGAGHAASTSGSSASSTSRRWRSRCRSRPSRSARCCPPRC